MDESAVNHSQVWGHSNPVRVSGVQLCWVGNWNTVLLANGWDNSWGWLVCRSYYCYYDEVFKRNNRESVFCHSWAGSMALGLKPAERHCEENMTKQSCVPHGSPWQREEQEAFRGNGISWESLPQWLPSSRWPHLLLDYCTWSHWWRGQPHDAVTYQEHDQLEQVDKNSTRSWKISFRTEF